jgi:hypothetical protein
MPSPKLSASSDHVSSVRSQEPLAPPEPPSADRIPAAQVIYSTGESSQLNARTDLVGSPYKAKLLSGMPANESKSANSSIYFTPTSKSHLQTPYRSTPLLTPPSSEERPPLPVFDAQSNSSADSSFGHEPPRQVPLTEQIMAQSAAYAQAIQRQQAVDGPRVDNMPATQSTASTLSLPGGQPQFSGSFATPSAVNLPTVPHLTYHQLQQQQQQQILNSQHLHQPQAYIQHSTTSPTQNNVDVAPPAPTYTPIDIPPGGLASEVATLKEIETIQTNFSAMTSHASKPISTIDKQDPLDNPHR